MKAIVTTEFNGCADGEKYPRPIKVGEIITGDLARSMVDAGYAEDEATKAKKPPLNKAMSPSRSKSGASLPQGQASRKKTARKSDGIKQSQ